MKYRKIKYKHIKKKDEKEIVQEYSLLYNNSLSYKKNLKKSLISTYDLDDKSILYNYNINDMKINSPKLYAIKVATKYFKNNYKKIVNNSKGYNRGFIFNIKDIKKDKIYGPYVLDSYIAEFNKNKKNRGFKKKYWHLMKYNEKLKEINNK